MRGTTPANAAAVRTLKASRRFMRTLSRWLVRSANLDRSPGFLLLLGLSNRRFGERLRLLGETAGLVEVSGRRCLLGRRQLLCGRGPLILERARFLVRAFRGRQGGLEIGFAAGRSDECDARDRPDNRRQRNQNIFAHGVLRSQGRAPGPAIGRPLLI